MAGFWGEEMREGVWLVREDKKRERMEVMGIYGGRCEWKTSVKHPRGLKLSSLI